MLAFTKNLVLRANLGYDLAGILVEADTESVLKARSNPQLCSGDNDIDDYSGLPSGGIAINLPTLIWYAACQLHLLLRRPMSTILRIWMWHC